MKKTVLTMFISLFAFTNLMISTEVKAESEPSIFGEYGVAIDAKTGEILFGKNEKDEASPASMTKVLTALLIAENMEDGEELSVTEQSLATECSCYGVEEGEILTKEDAIHALMIQSANDVSVAVAEHIGGSIEEFSVLMNERAEKIGVSEKTHFVTPNGLDDEKHRVTPYDMALIVREAVKNPEVLEAMKAKEYTVESNKKTLTLTRHDNISSVEHAIGGKTGYTSKAGNTLAVYYEDGEKEIVTVVMASNKANHYNDSSIMEKYASEQIEVHTLYEKNQEVEQLEVNNKNISLLATEDFHVTRLKDKKEDYEVETKLTTTKDVVKSGDKIGVADVYEGDVKIGSFELTVNEDVVLKQIDVKKDKVKKDSALSIWWALGVPWAFYMIYLFYYNFEKRKKIKAKN